MNDAELAQLLQHDFSAGTQAFAEALLKRCLSELDQDIEYCDISDEDLELLAAAGDIASNHKRTDE